MATSQAGSDSEAYKAFLKLVRAINPKIKATTGMPIFYMGKVRGSNVFEQIKDLQERWSKRNAVDGHYVTLSDVISDLPSPIPQFRSMLDFAKDAGEKKLITRDEAEEVWATLSGYFAQKEGRAGRKLFFWQGTTMAKSPILEEIELPVLLFAKNLKKLDRKIIQQKMKKVTATQREIQEIDADFRKFYDALRKRQKYLQDYRLADQMTKWWN
jgi:hypothetical protein